MRPLASLHVVLHALPSPRPASESIALDNGTFERLLVDAHQAQPFGMTFEEAAAALAELPRMFCEPDGSFVWVSPHLEQPAWQLDGVLYDRQNRLLLVDLKGTCHGAVFDQLLGCFGWPATAVMVQLVRQAVYLDEAEFRRWCGWA